MTDDTLTTNAAGNDLAIPGAAPAPPIAPMSYAEAESRKAEMINDAETRNKILAGDVATTALWNRVVEALSRQPELPATSQEQAAAHLQESSGYTLSEAHLQEIIERRPVTPEEYRMARGRFESRIADPEWCAKLNRNDLEAKRELALIQSILSRPIRTPEVK